MPRQSVELATSRALFRSVSTWESLFGGRLKQCCQELTPAVVLLGNKGNCCIMATEVSPMKQQRARYLTNQPTHPPNQPAKTKPNQPNPTKTNPTNLRTYLLTYLLTCNNDRGRQTRFRTKKTLRAKISSIRCLLSCKVRQLVICW